MSKFRTDHLAVEVVDWIDSNCRTRWNDKSAYDNDMEDTLMCRTVGFVLHEKEDRVALLQSESADNFSEMMTIPKVAITKRTVLREASKTEG